MAKLLVTLLVHLWYLRISTDWHACTCRLPLGKLSDWKVDRCPSFRGKYIYMQLFVWAVESLNQTLKAISRGFGTSRCAHTRLPGDFLGSEPSIKLWGVRTLIYLQGCVHSSLGLVWFCCRWIPPANQGLGFFGQRLMPTLLPAECHRNFKPLEYHATDDAFISGKPKPLYPTFVL